MQADSLPAKPQGKPFHLCVKSKKRKNIYNRTETLISRKLLVVARGEGSGKIGKSGKRNQKVQITSYKINKSHECNVLPIIPEYSQ